MALALVVAVDLCGSTRVATARGRRLKASGCAIAIVAALALRDFRIARDSRRRLNASGFAIRHLGVAGWKSAFSSFRGRRLKANGSILALVFACAI